MKKQILLLISSAFLLTGCGETTNFSSSETIPSSSEAVSPTCMITTSAGGSVEVFKSGKSYGKVTNDSSLVLENISVGDNFTIKAEAFEGYKASIVTFNNSTIKGEKGYYNITISEGTNNVNFSFKLIETDVNDFGYELDEEKKEATIISYSPDEIPTPVILPTKYTKNNVEYMVTGIASGAFDNCEATKITVSSSIKNIEYGAFKNAYNMHYFDVDSASNTYSALDGVLLSKDGTEIVAFPARYEKTSYTMSNAIASIAPYAFYCNRVIKELTFSSSLTSIGEYCFYNANKMVHLSFPSSLKRIADYAFFQNSELTTIEFAEGLEEIGPSAFYGLVKLQSLSFPKSLKVIRDNAFFKCDRLSSITFQEGLEEIETLAFSNLTNITKIVFPSTLKVIGKSAFSACSVLESVTFSEGLEEIGGSAFALCSSLKGVSLPASLKKIDSNPFYAILNLSEENFKISSENANFVISDGVLYTKDMSKLITYAHNRTSTSYSIPSTVKELGNMAFATNGSLLELNMPLSVTRIDESFYGVTSRLHIIYEGTEDQFSEIDKTGTNSNAWNEGAYSLYVTCSDTKSE